MNAPNYPRTISPAITFNSLVDWFYGLINKKNVPGLLVGLSGTDSLVSFIAASEALVKAGKPERMMGVHFAPSEDFLYDHPEAETHLWFRDKVIPWLRSWAPKANIVVDTSIDWRADGQRWGALMDMSVVSNDKRRMMRLPEEQYWVVGTRNRTENELLNYSNVSTAASLQPLMPLWKSEVLQISEYLGVPKIAIDKSCETDCICGRMALAANHIREVDLMLMSLRGELSSQYVENKIPLELRDQLLKFIQAQVAKNSFKNWIPYKPKDSITWWSKDPMVQAFEQSTINIKDFNHRQHLYVAWCYLKDFPFEEAVGSYTYYLKHLLELTGNSHRFNEDITRKYFEMLDQAMKSYPTNSFDELMDKSGILNIKITA